LTGHEFSCISSLDGLAESRHPGEFKDVYEKARRILPWRDRSWFCQLSQKYEERKATNREP